MLYGLAKCAPTYAAQQRQYITQLQQLFSTRMLPIATAFERYGPKKVQLM
jgi:tRNA(fMet)-specific endonuclease VapC